MRVNHRSGNVFVPQKFLNCTDVLPFVQQMSGKAVSERMATCRFSDSRARNRCLDSLLQILFGNVVATFVARTRINGELHCWENILPDPGSVRVTVLPFECKWQVNTSVAAGQNRAHAFPGLVLNGPEAGRAAARARGSHDLEDLCHRGP